MEMNRSESIANLAAALSAFQSSMPTVKKDSNNPFFKSKYASLDTIIESVKAPLAANGLSLSQFPTPDCGLLSILMHKSGEFISVEMKMVPKDDTPQGQGSALTYMRRYAMASILGLATDEDDDGNTASNTQQSPKYQFTATKTLPNPVVDTASQFEAPFPDDVPIDQLKEQTLALTSTCPVHNVKLVTGKFGPYCPNKLPTGRFCKGK